MSLQVWGCVDLYTKPRTVQSKDGSFLLRLKKFKRWSESVFVRLSSGSDGLDVDEVAVLGPLPLGLDALQLSAMKREAGPGRQLEQGAGDRHENQNVETAQAERRSPWAGGRVRHQNRVLRRLPLKNIVTWGGKEQIPQMTDHQYLCISKICLLTHFFY